MPRFIRTCPKCGFVFPSELHESQEAADAAMLRAIESDAHPKAFCERYAKREVVAPAPIEKSKKKGGKKA